MCSHGNRASMARGSCTKKASWCVQNARQEALVQQHMTWDVSGHTVQALFTNVPHALRFDASQTGCATRTHTEFAHTQARSARSPLSRSADHVLLCAMNLNLCGHTFFYDYMFVMKEARFTQPGPASFFPCLNSKTPSSNNTASCVPHANCRT